MNAGIYSILRHPGQSKLIRNLFAAICVGLFTGLIVGCFRWIIDQTLAGLAFIYPLMSQHPVYLIPYIIGTLIICWLLGKVIRPELQNLVGSGVPQIEAVMLDINQLPWWSILWRKFVGGLLAICPGLFLGREGPCIEMGAMVGQGLATQVFHLDKDDQRLLLSCGVAAGLSAAFSAPIAGTLFLLEEITFQFKAKTAVTALAAAIVSDLVTIVFFGTKPCLYLPIKGLLPMSAYLPLIVVGLILGIFAYVYQYVILTLPSLYGHLKLIPRHYHSIVPLLLVIPIGLWKPIILGGSHNLINYLVKGNFAHLATAGSGALLTLAAVMLLVRFVFSMVSYGSSVPGGIFMPILVLGALFGVVFAVVMIQWHLVPATNYINIVVICMTAYFGAIEKAPFTAVTLLTEMVGSVEQIFPMLLVIFITYVVNDWLGGRPIYSALRLQIYGK